MPSCSPHVNQLLPGGRVDFAPNFTTSSGAPFQGSLLLSTDACRAVLHVAGTVDDTSSLQALHVNGSGVASSILPWRRLATLPNENHTAVVFAAPVTGSPDLGEAPTVQAGDRSPA